MLKLENPPNRHFRMVMPRWLECWASDLKGQEIETNLCYCFASLQPFHPFHSLLLIAQYMTAEEYTPRFSMIIQGRLCCIKDLTSSTEFQLVLKIKGLWDSQFQFSGGSFCFLKVVCLVLKCYFIVSLNEGRICYVGITTSEKCQIGSSLKNRLVSDDKDFWVVSTKPSFLISGIFFSCNVFNEGV